MECFYYSRAEAVNAGALNGSPLPLGPPPESYTLKDMIQFLRSFSSDQKIKGNVELGIADPNHEYNSQIYNILSDMDGSHGWIRLDCDDINKVIRRWELDVRYTMNGGGFQESPFGIVKTFIESDAILNKVKMLQWMDLVHYMGFKLNVYQERNWIDSRVLMNAADVLTLPFCGKCKHVAVSYLLDLCQEK
jgi:hypothetical protein